VKRILVIEDNAIAASLYQAALSRDGYVVELAADGEAGLAAVARARPDLVLLDLMLPKVDGAEVLRRIRGNDALAGMPVIITSNAYTAERREQLRRAGATQVVPKSSLSPRELARVVKIALEVLEPVS
jgi:CheY-like chemotaxis protein